MAYVNPFPQVRGHEALREHLFNAYKNGTLSHAYIFEGMKGSGRKTLATALAQLVLCEGADGAAAGCGCGTCRSCKSLANGNNPDFRHIVKPADRQQIGAQQIREELVSDMAVRPFAASKKIYVIDEAELLTDEAQNVLLKTLEEPPEYGLIILVTTSGSALIPTVHSRCVKLNFEPLKKEIVASELKNRGYSDSEAALGAALAGGNIGEGLRYIADGEYLSARSALFDMILELPFKGSAWALMQEDMLESFKGRPSVLFMLLLSCFRDMLVYSRTGDNMQVINADYAQKMAKTAGKYGTDRLCDILVFLTEMQSAVEGNANYSLTMDMLLLKLSAED